ncbi:MAG: tetratricopeptide repeat protein, partial [Pseudomonadota bacterium]|nr:tetratricopeptide repeat protein [Pseudomonadota bacterium]
EDKTFNRAIVLNKLAIMALHDNINDAHKYIEQAFEINSTNPDILDTLGWILVQKGQLEDGLGHLRKAFARDSNNPEIRYHIGYALAKLNRNQEAKEELKKAVAVERPFYNRSKAQALLDSL